MVGSLGQREQECEKGVEIVAFVKDEYKSDYVGKSRKVTEYKPPADAEYDVYYNEPTNTAQLFYKPTGELVNCSKIVKYPWVWNNREQCRFYYDVETKDICKDSAKALDAMLAGDAEAELKVFSGSILFVGSQEESVYKFNERGRNIDISFQLSESLPSGGGSTATGGVSIGGEGEVTGHVKTDLGPDVSSTVSKIHAVSGRKMLM